MIIGDDLMQELGIDLIYSTEVPCIKWEEVEVPMKPRGSLNRELLQNLYSMHSDDPAIIEKAEKRRQVVYDADYSQPDLLEYCTEQKNLSTEEQNMLYNLLKDHPVLFSGGLGKLNIKPVSIELTENAKPYHIRQPFNIPHIYMGTTKREIDRLCSIEVIEKNSDSEWACGTFITPKKTGDVRVVTDLRELNKFVKRKPFPLPKIKDLLQSLANFQYATAVDLSMGYYPLTYYYT